MLRPLYRCTPLAKRPYHLHLQPNSTRLSAHRFNHDLHQRSESSNTPTPTKFQSIIVRVATFLGYNTRRQVSARRALAIYRTFVRDQATLESDFWRSECNLPETFQTWFTVTNLHIWLLTVRFRALPPPYGKYFLSALIDHFFEDVDKQLRIKLPTRVSERLVTRQLKACRDQWRGVGLSLDYGLITSDAELAGAIWRNFLGARGALGLEGTGQAQNIYGLSEKYPEENELIRDPTVDDKSGIRDFEASERDKYVEFPQLVWTLARYIRKEVARLESIDDLAIINEGDVGVFSSISQPIAEHDFN